MIRPASKLPVGHRVEDLVERHHFESEAVRQQQTQRQETPWSSCRARRCEPSCSSLDGQRLAGDDHRAIAVAHAASARQQGVLVEQCGVGVDADGRHFQFAAQSAAVERLDVLQLVTELQIAGVESCRGPGRRT